ncbi:HK97 family phage prohead protease [Parvibaculum sp.]|uniref:HK97 family phage prohead protease n=1 Tax=Parvibaculum sp. TaxID=2024848 RepID=UPI00273103A2|nr:HK97 family phage prohead protease [Parvibaculum sp.]MDP1627500.1 HK97 family phage prohead protease [Parvibaculum sp.]MDP2148679.1 HK97 family phage prohead protease [Parvibaculum sp.]MDP3326705.1 HK97 family phage prohead protease [Parvibaculum sp.]
MRGGERKAARFLAKAVKPDGTFEGYASLFGAEDLGRDVVMPGAFRKSLLKRGPKGVKLLYQHEPNEVIGIWTGIAEDHEGLFVRGQLLQDVSRAREVLALMRAGAVDGLSIGYRVVKAEADRATGARRLIEVDLWEISVVTFPMLPEARVRAVKGARPTTREFERWLMRDAGLSRTEARTVIHKGFKALNSPREAGGPGDAALARALRLAARLFNN